MKKMEKHLKRVLSILLVAVLLAQAAWTPTTSRAATDSEATANKDVYVSASGSDSADGTEAAPLKTLEKAFQVVANGGTIHIVGTVETGSWSAHGKNLTITGGTLKFNSDEHQWIKLNGLGGLGDALTFENITIDAVDNHRLLANGCKIKIGENVTTTGKPYIYGGCYTTTKETLYGDTYVEVNSGTWGRIYGGGNDASTLKGSTHVVVDGTAVCDAIYGSGMGDHICGDTNVTVTGNATAEYVYGGGTFSHHGTLTIDGSTNVLISGTPNIMSVYGGSNLKRDADYAEYDVTTTNDVNVLITGGTIQQVFGGNYGEVYTAPFTGDVDVRILGGEVTRRVYGGNYNEYDLFTGFATGCSVNGNIRLTLGGEANISFTSTGSDASDQGIFARSRYNQKSDSEIATIIFDDEKAYTTYADKLGAHDSGASLVMGDVTAADSVHYYTYTASDNIITASCDGTLCDTEGGHSATATLSAIKDEFAYTGNAIEGARIVYDDTWNAAPLEIVYTDNDKEGTATATCTKNSVSVSVNFEIKSTALSGKKISILGDSISTFGGVSNNANFNKTIGKNNAYYPKSDVTAQNKTYWGQLIEKYGMNLCVNNSTGGGKVSIDVGTDGVRPSGIKRSTELHNNDGQEPDIILVNMGTNDLADTGISLAQFAEAYTQMLDNMLEKYENAEIFCFTLLPGRDYSSTETANGETFEKYLIKFNNQIERIVGGYEDRVTLVDMYTESGIAWNNLSLYTCDYSETYPGLHPNAEGMQLMAKVLERELLEAYDPTALSSVPEVSFDLDIDVLGQKVANVGTDNVEIATIGNNGQIMTKDIVYKGWDCKVPVYYAPQALSDTDNSYLDVWFKDIDSLDKTKSWIFDNGITFECFLYVDTAPSGSTSCFMTNMNSGGFGFTSRDGMNFRIGTDDTSTAGFSHGAYAATNQWSADQTLDAETLTHVMATYDPTTNMMAIYKNGECIGSHTYSTGKEDAFKMGTNAEDRYGHLGLGTNIGAPTESLDDGTAYAIADARVYSGSLTAKQAKQEYINRRDEILATATDTEVTFDLDIDVQNKTVDNAVTGNAITGNVTVSPEGKGEVQTKNILFEDRICEVPVYYAEKDTVGNSYLDVHFENIDTLDETKSWIFDNGITFECLLYVDKAPSSGTAGLMTNMYKGGFGLTSKNGMNFRMGRNVNGSNSYAASNTMSTTQTLDEETLTHVVGTYDPDTNKLSFYKNGELLGASDYSAGKAADFVMGTNADKRYGHLGLGTNIAELGESLDDETSYAIADARVYSGGLSAEQVKEVYNNSRAEVLETAIYPEVYFDLDFEDGVAVSTGTNAANTTITSSGKGNVTTMKVAHNGELCDVPVYYAPKDENGTDGTNKSYLDVTFKDIADITNATEKENALKDWIFNDGISFECFIYVDEIPNATAGFMTSMNAGGIGFYSYKVDTNNWGELNFRLGTNDAKTATYPFDSRYAMAFPSSNSKADVGGGFTTSMIGKLQLAQEYQTLNEKELTHVVGTYDVERNVLSIYKNGELISEGSYSQGGKNDFRIMSAAIGHIGLGANIAWDSERMDRYTSYAIADARIYSGALTAEQVAEQYNNRWDDVATYAVSGDIKVTQLDDLSKYESVTTDKSQAIGEDLPAYYYGSIASASYKESTTGDRAALNDADYTLHVFSNTTHSEYVSYLKSLEDAEWEQYSNNIIEGKNLFATYTKDGKSVYAYYIASKASTYIVVSETSYLENRKEDNDYKVVCDPLFTEVRTISSSQCEIVRLSDGRFIIIDSGQRDKDGTYQPERIYEVLKEQNVLDKITVAAWIITHPHTDHMYACADFLTQYGAGDLDIEEIIFNFPNEEDYVAADSSMSTTVPQFYTALATAKTEWSGMDIITCHTGQEYHIADATIEILHTIEDSFPLKVNELADKVNDSSVAFKIKIAGQEIMILGDSGASVSDDLVDMWGDYLKSDFVQMSHHGMRGGTVELYEHVDPTVVTIPTTRGLMDPNLTENVDYIGKQEASVWVLVNLGKNIKEVNVAGYGTRTFTLPYTPENKDYISNIKQNGYEMKEGDKVKADDIPEPYADLGFNGTDLIDNGTADNTFTMVGGSVGENTVYYKGKPYTVTSYRAEKTSSNYEHIKLTMNDITSADELKNLLIKEGHTLEMFFATDSAPTTVGGLMSNCYNGGVTLYARRLGVLCYQLGNNSKADTYHNDNYASASYIYTKNEFNFEVGNTVTHVVATYDKAEGKLKIYQNGVLISEGTYTDPDTYFKHSTKVDTLLNQMGIGINLASTGEALGKETGYTVIKSRIYDESLSAEQVASEYWSCIEDLTGDENIYDDWDPEEADTSKKVTVPFTKAEVETFLSNKTHPTRKGYLFGGWYTTTDIPEIDADNYEASAEEAMKVAIQDTVPDGVETVYALFVPEEVLTVKAQISGNLIDKDDTNDEKGSIRFVTTVDSLMYKRVGFKVEYVNSSKENKTIISDSKTVYEKLSAVDMSGNIVKELTYSPTQFCSVSKYFKACTVESLSAKNFTREFTVTPFWETMDGSVVYGEPVVKSINQYLETLK